MKKFRWLAALLMVLMCASFMGCPPLPPELESYTVEFDSDGGSSVYDQTVNSGTTATEPKNPVKEGYTFEGWYLGDNLYDFSISSNTRSYFKSKMERNS